MTTPQPVPPEAGSLVDHAVEAAGRLALADALSDGPRGIADLAVATGTHGPSLRRLLRALACVHVVDEVAEGVFALPHERPSGPVAAGPAIRLPMFGAASLLYSVRTGEPFVRQLLDQPVFDYIGSDPGASAALAAFTAAATERSAPALVAASDFGRFSTVIDVGGGAGTLIKHILRACGKTEGVVFDTPAATTAAVAELSSAPEIAGRWRVRAGDFFDAVPSGADVYVLKSVLHDWDDAEAARILGNCRAVMTPGTRLIIFEPVMPRITTWSPAQLPAVLSDLICLVLTDGGRERTEAEYRDLLAGASLEVVDVSPVPDSTHFYRVEAVAGE